MIKQELSGQKKFLVELHAGISLLWNHDGGGISLRNATKQVVTLDAGSGLWEVVEIPGEPLGDVADEFKSEVGHPCLPSIKSAKLKSAEQFGVLMFQSSSPASTASVLPKFVALWWLFGTPVMIHHDQCVIVLLVILVLLYTYIYIYIHRIHACILLSFLWCCQLQLSWLHLAHSCHMMPTGSLGLEAERLAGGGWPGDEGSPILGHMCERQRRYRGRQGEDCSRGQGNNHNLIQINSMPFLRFFVLFGRFGCKQYS